MNTIIISERIKDAVYNLCITANTRIPADFYSELRRAYEEETSPGSKEGILQLLENIKLSKNSAKPLCQDTGLVIVFVKIGQDIKIEGDIKTAINEGVEKAYKDYPFRKSVVTDPVFNRENTKNNLPAIVYFDTMPGNNIKIDLLIKGAGSENMSTLKMLKPSEGIEGIINFAIETVKNAGSNPCPPIRLGIGIGGSYERCPLLAKKALLQPINSLQVLQNKTDNYSNLAKEIIKKTNELKIGANGLGGSQTVLGVNIIAEPCHIASMPVAININCNASRHAQATITPDKTVFFDEIFDYEFAETELNEKDYKNIDLSNIETIKELKAGEKVLLSGTIYTARDAAHKKITELINKNEPLPFDLKNKIIYYTGPCPAREGEVIGSAGPTTSGRMDIYTPKFMQLGMLGSIGKGKRTEAVKNAISENHGIYFIATGGAACLLSSRIKDCSLVAFEELGPEAVYKLEIEKFPVTVGIDSNGNTATEF